MALAVSLLLAALLGFAIHRGSVCMVRGVAEVLSTGRAYMLLSFGKAAIWVLIVTTPVLWLTPATPPLGDSWAFSGYALAGGFLFGIGAAVSRGCAFSTLGRLGNGEVGAVLTLGGFAAGAWSYLSAVTWSSLSRPEPIAAADDPLDPVAGAFVVALAAWGVWEIARLWRGRPAGASWIGLVLARSFAHSRCIRRRAIGNTRANAHAQVEARNGASGASGGSRARAAGIPLAPGVPRSVLWTRRIASPGRRVRCRARKSAVGRHAIRYRLS